MYYSLLITFFVLVQIGLDQISKDHQNIQDYDANHNLLPVSKYRYNYVSERPVSCLNSMCSTVTMYIYCLNKLTNNSVFFGTL